jgi:hypothetical protein
MIRLRHGRNFFVTLDDLLTLPASRRLAKLSPKLNGTAADG